MATSFTEEEEFEFALAREQELKLAAQPQAALPVAEQPIKMPSLAESVLATLKQVPRPPVMPSEVPSIKEQQQFIQEPNVFQTEPMTKLKEAGEKVKETAVSAGMPKFAADILPFTPQEFAEQGAQEMILAPVLAGAGALVKKGAQAFDVAGKAEKIMASALKILPTQRTKIFDMAGKTPEKWLLERGIKGSPDDIANQTRTIWKNSKNKVDELLSKSKGQYNFKQEKQALDELEVLYKGTSGNEGKLSKITELKSKIGEDALTGKKTGLNLSELNEIKRLLDDADLIFKKSGGVKTGVTSEGLENIRNNIQNYIENAAKKEGIPNIKQLNNQTQIAYEITDSIADKSIRQMGNNVFSLTEKIILAGGVSALGGALAGGVKTGATSAAVSGVVLAGEHIASDPKFKISLATALQKLSGEEFKLLEGYVKGKVTAEANATLKNVINTALRQSGIEAVKPKDDRIKVPALR